MQQTSTVRPVYTRKEKLASPSNSSDWNNDDKWSSQEWKSGEMSKTSTERPVFEDESLTSTSNQMKTGTGRPVSNKLVIDIDMDSGTAAESDLSLRSLAFLSRVNNRLRKMLNRSPEDPMQDIDKRSLIWDMFMSSKLEASVFLGKSYKLHSIKNTGEESHLKEDVRDI